MTLANLFSNWMFPSKGCQDINPEISFHININTETIKRIFLRETIYQGRDKTRGQLSWKWKTTEVPNICLRPTRHKFFPHLGKGQAVFCWSWSGNGFPHLIPPLLSSPDAKLHGNKNKIIFDWENMHYVSLLVVHKSLERPSYIHPSIPK